MEVQVVEAEMEAAVEEAAVEEAAVEEAAVGGGGPGPERGDGRGGGAAGAGRGARRAARLGVLAAALDEQGGPLLVLGQRDNLRAQPRLREGAGTSSALVRSVAGG